MNIKYQFFEEHGLLIQKISGKFMFKGYGQYSQFILQQYATKPVKKILLDFRDILFEELETATVDRVEEAVNKMADLRQSFQKDIIKRTDIKHVFWVIKPLPTVIATLFTEHFPGLDYTYCSTTDMVYKELEVASSAKALESMVDNLQNTF